MAVVCYCAVYYSDNEPQCYTGRFRPAHANEKGIDYPNKKAKLDKTNLALKSTPGRVRTPNPQGRNLVLYPVELRAHTYLMDDKYREMFTEKHLF